MVCLRLLDHKHMEGPHHAACDFSPLWSRIPTENREALLFAQLAVAFVTDLPLERPCLLHLLVPRVQTTLRLRGYGSLAPDHRPFDPRLFGYRVRQDRRDSEKLHFFDFSLTDSQDSSGVSHGFLSLMTTLR